MRQSGRNKNTNIYELKSNFASSRLSFLQHYFLLYCLIRCETTLFDITGAESFPKDAYTFFLFVNTENNSMKFLHDYLCKNAQMCLRLRLADYERQDYKYENFKLYCTYDYDYRRH